MTQSMVHFCKGEVDQIVRIQLPSAEDGEGFLQNIQFKNKSFVEQF